MSSKERNIFGSVPEMPAIGLESAPKHAHNCRPERRVTLPVGGGHPIPVRVVLREARLGVDLRHRPEWATGGPATNVVAATNMVVLVRASYRRARQYSNSESLPA